MELPWATGVASFDLSLEARETVILQFGRNQLGIQCTLPHTSPDASKAKQVEIDDAEHIGSAAGLLLSGQLPIRLTPARR